MSHNYTCDPCVCQDQNFRDELLFRRAMLHIWCQILADADALVVDPSTATLQTAGNNLITASNVLLTAISGKLTAPLEVISRSHKKAHDGKAFYGSGLVGGLGAGVTKYWRITTPNTATRVHLNFSLSTNDSGLLNFYENPTINVAGTAVAIRSANRDASSAPETTFFEDDTYTALGSLITRGYVYQYERFIAFGRSRFDNEMILKGNEDYTIGYTAVNAATNASLLLEFYEV